MRDVNIEEVITSTPGQLLIGWESAPTNSH